MAVISKDFSFEAAHFLPNHNGKCSRLHGHSYKFSVIVQGDIYLQDLPVPFHSSHGMVLDFGDISAVVKPIIEERLDHWFLNYSLPEIPVHTAEMIGAWLFGAIVTRSERINPVDGRNYGIRPEQLTIIVQETETSNAQVEEDDWEAVGRPTPNPDFKVDADDQWLYVRNLNTTRV